MSEQISMRCPSCNGRNIFIGTGGHLTCSYIECPEPVIAQKIDDLMNELAEYKEHFEPLMIKLRLDAEAQMEQRKTYKAADDEKGWIDGG